MGKFLPCFSKGLERERDFLNKYNLRMKKSLCWLFAGNTVCLDLPFNPEFSQYSVNIDYDVFPQICANLAKADYKKGGNVLGESALDEDALCEQGLCYVLGEWLRSVFYSAEWLLNEFVSTKASIPLNKKVHINVSVIMHAALKEFYAGSFFHPDVFEKALMDYLSDPSFACGVFNWRHLRLENGLYAMGCDMYKDAAIYRQARRLTRHIFFSLREGSFIHIECDLGELTPGNNTNSLFLALTLFDNIVASLRLSMGDVTLNHWHAVRQHCLPID